MNIENSQEVCKEVKHFFSQYLLSNQPVLDYLMERGINKKLVEKELVGFCPPFFNYQRFPLLKGRITVPIYDAYGSIIAFAGRKFEPTEEITKQIIRDSYNYDLAKSEKKVEMWERAKWINEVYPKMLHLYNLNYAKQFIRKNEYVIVTEGYFDSLVLFSNGLQNVVSVCSTHISEKHMVLLNRYCDKIVVLLDGDERGEKATDEMVENIQQFGMKAYAIYLPNNYDPDDFVIKYGSKKLRKIINYAIREDKTKLKLNIKEDKDGDSC